MSVCKHYKWIIFVMHMTIYIICYKKHFAILIENMAPNLKLI